MSTWRSSPEPPEGLGIYRMTQKNIKIMDAQLAFFNENAILDKPEIPEPFFLKYAAKEVVSGFLWLGDRKRVLDYGCGTGTSIDGFFRANPRGNNIFIGVDIADVAVRRIAQRYPKFNFYTIVDNKIPQLPDGGVDGAYLLHVLHHSHEHENIFKEIYSKLEPGGKLFLSDLSSSNPIIKLFRSLFVLAPSFVKQRFSDDLVVDGNIPEKYKVNPEVVLGQLRDAGFSIQEVGYGHLGLFLFAWFDRFIPLSRLVVFRALYSSLWVLEQKLLSIRMFNQYSEVFYIKCIK